MSTIQTFLPAALSLVTVVAVLYCIVIGFQFVSADSEKDKKRRGQHLKNAVIGFLILWSILLVLNLAVPRLTRWVSEDSDASITDIL